MVNRGPTGLVRSKRVASALALVALVQLGCEVTTVAPGPDVPQVADTGADGMGGEDTALPDIGPVPEQPEGGLPLLGGDCDPMVPDLCGLPFPSNVYLLDDDRGKNPSGKSVRFG